MRNLILVLALLTLAADSGKKAQCHRQCYNCETRCQHSQDMPSCRAMCLEIKRSCCTSCGAGPGPKSTCSCS
jgi:hypothetical protein